MQMKFTEVTNLVSKAVKVEMPSHKENRRKRK